MKLKGIHDIITATGGGRTLGINISIGGLGLTRAQKPSGSFKINATPAKAKKKNKTVNIRLFPEEGGLLKMYIED